MLSCGRRVGAVGVVVALACGCAVKQPPPPDQALTGILPSTTVVPSAWTAPAGATGAAMTEWVRTFGDVQLELLVDEALLNNLDLQAAAARVDVAQGLITQARAPLLPQISLAGGAGVVGRDGIKDRSGLVGEISWELDFWGRVRAQAASAAAAREAADADLLYARQSLAATVAKLWYQTIATERLRVTAAEAAVVHDELLRLVQTKHRVGKVSMQDVALAGADRDRALHLERVYANSEQQVVRGLEIVVGRYPRAELGLAADLPALAATGARRAAVGTAGAASRSDRGGTARGRRVPCHPGGEGGAPAARGLDRLRRPIDQRAAPSCQRRHRVLDRVRELFGADLRPAAP